MCLASHCPEIQMVLLMGTLMDRKFETLSKLGHPNHLISNDLKNKPENICTSVLKKKKKSQFQFDIDLTIIYHWIQS